MAKRSVKKNFLYNTGYQVLKVMTPLVTTPYLARILHAHGVGLFSYTQSITSYFVMFAVLGMSNYGVRAIATAGDRPSRSKVFWSVYASQLYVFVAVLAAYIAYLLLGASGHLVLGLCWLPWVISAGLDVSWLFFGVEDFKLTAIRSMVIKVAELAGIFLLVRTEADVWLYCLLVALEFLFDQLAVWPFVRQFVDWYRPSWNEVKVHFLPNLKLFIPVIAISLYNSLDTIIMGKLTTMKETGFYQYSFKVTTFPLAAITAMGTVMLPHMSNAFSEGDREYGLRTLRLTTWTMLVMAFAFTWGIVGVAPEFVPVFLGPEFAPCVLTVTLLSIDIVFVSVTNVIGIQYLLPLYRDSQYTASVLLGGILNVVVSLFLIPRLGAFGSAWGTVAAEFTVLVVQCLFVRKELELGTYLKDALPLFTSGAIMAACLRVLAGALVPALGIGVGSLGIEVLCGAVIYVVLVGGWCLATHDEKFDRLFGGRLRRMTSKTAGRR